MKVRPLHNQVIIRQNKADEKIAGGLLYAPQSSQEKPFEGEVLAVGPGKTLDNGVLVPMTVKVGDKVLFTKYALTEVKLDNEDYVLVKEDAILGVFNNDNEKV